SGRRRGNETAHGTPLINSVPAHSVPCPSRLHTNARWRPLYSHFVPAPLPATQRCIDEAGIGQAHRGQYEPSRQGANRGVANEQVEWPGRVEWRARLQIGRSQLEQPGRQEDQEHPDIVASQPATQCPPQRDAERSEERRVGKKGERG